MSLAWIQALENLSPTALTVRAQTISPNNDGMLKYDMFFPRVDVDSVDLDEVTTLDYRPTADRREWNQRGRLVPVKTPDKRRVSIVPIEAYYKYGEREMQTLNERTLGNAQLVQDIIGTQIPARTEQLVMADYRRLEVDAFAAWGLGTITQRNPQNAAETFAASFGFSATRYQTAGTAWNDASLNAYNELNAWLIDAISAVGPIQGIVCRLNFVTEVVKDMQALASSVRLTRANVMDEIAQNTGQPFQFYVLEDTVDVFDDGGTATTATKVWPANRIAAVPQNLVVGNTAFAPVVRAMELARNAPEAGIDVRGATVYYLDESGGRQLQIEAQLNALPIPDENKLFVENVGF